MKIIFTALLLLFGLINFGILIYLIWLAHRLVRATEEIAHRSGLVTRMLEVLLEKTQGKPSHSAAHTES